MFSKFLKRFPYTLIVILQTVGLPLLLVLFGYFEWNAYVDDANRSSNVERVQRMQEIDEALTYVQGQPEAQIENNGKSYRGSMAATQLRLLRSKIQLSMKKSLSDESLGHAQTASLVAIVCGLLASLLGVVGMVAVYLSGQSALHSRDALLESFGRWTRLLPTYLGALLLLTAVGYAALTVVRTFSSIELFMNRYSGAELKLSVFLWMMAASMTYLAAAAVLRLRGALAFLQGTPSQVEARSLSIQEAPGLWDYVSQLAKAVGAPLPKNIVVGMDESFYVTAHPLELLPSKEALNGQTLHLPLTYLTLLRRDEVDAILAHELGHFAGDDTTYSSRFSPLYGGMIDALERIEAAGQESVAASPAIYFSRYVLQRFDLAVKHWSRVREFAADAVGASVGGPEASARALVHVTALAPRVHERVAQIARRPEEAGHDLFDMLSESVRSTPLELPDFDAEMATTHPRDTHPPTLDRLKALGVPLTSALVQETLAPPDASSLIWVRSLFVDSESLQQRLLDDFKMSWRQHNEEARQMLQALTSQVPEHMEIRDSKLGMVFTSTFFVLLASIFGWLVYSGFFVNTKLAGILVMGGLFGGGALFFLVWTIASYRRAKLVIMTLSLRGFRVNGIQEEVSWGAVEDYSTNISYGMVALVFKLLPATHTLTRERGPMRLTYKPKKRHLSFAIKGVKGMKTRDFFALIGQYLNAWHAQAALDDM